MSDVYRINTDNAAPCLLQLAGFLARRFNVVPIRTEPLVCFTIPTEDWLTVDWLIMVYRNCAAQYYAERRY